MAGDRGEGRRGYSFKLLKKMNDIFQFPIFTAELMYRNSDLKSFFFYLLFKILTRDSVIFFFAFEEIVFMTRNSRVQTVD